ncbi:MAG: mevalonate kinase [Candidatus Woesearchaeota archaeon]
MSITAKACAKSILLGEHAVVYGKYGISIPIKSLYTLATASNENYNFETDKELDEEEYKKLSKVLKLVYEKLNKKISIKIESNIPTASGLGSSASLCIAIIRAISNYYKLNLENEKINEIAFECEKIFHGTPSGIDNTTIVYEKPILFKKGKFEFINLKKPLHLIIANSGIKSKTKEVVEEVKKNYLKNENKYSEIFEKINEISLEAKIALEKNDLKKLGKLMVKNHELLCSIDLSNTEINNLVNKSLKNGAFGSKLVGSGKGGNIIALVDEKNKLKVYNSLKEISKEVYMCVIT